MYYKFIPVMKDNSKYNNGFHFVGDDTIVHTKFRSIQDGLEAAKLDKICLREQNWEILECGFFSKKRIMLKTLQSLGYLSSVTTKDNISEIYHHL